MRPTYIHALSVFAALVLAVPFSTLGAEAEQTAEAANPFSFKMPMDTGGDAKIKIWYSGGSWHLAWISKARDSAGKAVKGEWHGSIVAVDGTSIIQRSRAMEHHGKEDTFQDRVEIKGSELRFTATTGVGGDGISFKTDGTKVKFDIYESRRRVPAGSIFIGAKAQNPSKVPFVLEVPQRRGGKERGSGRRGR